MADADCIFCRIVAGEIPAEVVYEDDHVFAFRDIKPIAPLHVLVIPKRHIATLNDCGEGDVDVIGRVMLAAAHVAREAGIAEDGYRTALSVNRGGGQEVFHVHLHVFGGRKLRWPPG